MPTEGEVVVAELPQADGQTKRRPVLILSVLPNYGDFLVCGVSTQLHQAIDAFDVVVAESDPAFAATGLKAASVIRLGFLAVLPRSLLVRRLGSVPPSMLHQLQRNLASYLCRHHDR